MTCEVVAELIRREGALTPEDVIRWLPEACDAMAKLAAAGTNTTVDATSLRVSRDGEPLVLEPRPLLASKDAGRAQVMALAALAFEMLKGAPPPATLGPDTWVGVRPELARVLAPALIGAGAADVMTLAQQLRALGKGQTAQYVKAPVHDTHVSGRKAADGKRAGELLGPYELIRRLGEGGMGEVYLARHVRLGREVAIKVLREELARMPEVVQRFFQEARVVNEINHPHIVQILDFVEEPGRVYCVMELLQGRTLCDLDRDEGPLAVRRVCRLMAQVCDALEAAHVRGVVHRDIKPENLFVTRTPDGSEFIKVLDFGIARRSVSAEVSRTQHGVVLGTPVYMSPEQAAGRPVDARTDLYALGVSLYEIFAGRSMMAVETPRRLDQTVRGEPIPPEVTELLAACLELDPAKRPATAVAARRVLKAVSEAPPPAREPTSALEVKAGVAAGARPSRTVAIVAAGVAVAVGALLVVSYLSSSDVPTRPPPPPASAPVGPASTNEPPKSDDKGKPPDAVVNRPLAPPPPSRVEPHRPTRPATPPTVVEPPAPDPAAVARAERQRRFAGLRPRYEALVQRSGESQLTTLERAAWQAAVEEAVAGDPSQAALEGAERAIDAAERRLGR